MARRVDHVYALTPDAQRCFDFFSDRCNLPVAWPFRTWAFASGAVAAGNVNVEFVHADGAPRWWGIALEPACEVDSLVATLDERGIPHRPPAPLDGRRPDGTLGTLWTNVGLTDLPYVFFCRYDPSFVNVGESRRRLGEELRAREGGMFGIERLEEIVVGAKDFATTCRRWQQLAEPKQPDEPGLWRLGDGPAIRVVSAGVDGPMRLVLRVRTLRPSAGAVRRLAVEAEEGLPRADEALAAAREPGPREAPLDADVLRGLDVRLCAE